MTVDMWFVNYGWNGTVELFYTSKKEIYHWSHESECKSALITHSTMLFIFACTSTRSSINLRLMKVKISRELYLTRWLQFTIFITNYLYVKYMFPTKAHFNGYCIKSIAIRKWPGLQSAYDTRRQGFIVTCILFSFSARRTFFNVTNMNRRWTHYIVCVCVSVVQSGLSCRKKRLAILRELIAQLCANVILKVLFPGYRSLLYSVAVSWWIFYNRLSR